LSVRSNFLVYFFFQAEDGIRDFHVTGVQTCALPIYLARHQTARSLRIAQSRPHDLGRACALVSRLDHMPGIVAAPVPHHLSVNRSEERRVGKERRSRGPT